MTLAPEDGFLILAQGMGIDKSYVTPVQLEVCVCRVSSTPKMLKKKEGNSIKKNCPVLQIYYNIFSNLTHMFDVFDSNPYGQWCEDKNFQTFCEVPWVCRSRGWCCPFSLCFTLQLVLFMLQNTMWIHNSRTSSQSLWLTNTASHSLVTNGNQSKVRVWQFLNTHTWWIWKPFCAYGFRFSHITLLPSSVCMALLMIVSSCNVYGHVWLHLRLWK